MTGHQPTEDDLLMDLIKTNRRTEGETMSKKQYEKHGDNNPWQAVNRFGSWEEAKATAGIYKNSIERQTITKKDILEDLKKVNDETEGLLTVEKYKEHGQYSISSLYNRFDSFTTARSKAYNI